MDDSHNNQGGVALIIVLCFISLMGLLTSSIVFVSQTTAKKINDVSEKYILEGASARGCWLLLDRKISNSSTDLDMNFDGEHFLRADGVGYPLDYYGNKVILKVTNMNSGFNISGANPGNALEMIKKYYFNNMVKYKEITSLINQVKDYTDKNYYMSSGVPQDGALPSALLRHGRLEYREEIFFIADACKFFMPDKSGMLSVFNVIPPKNMSAVKGSPNFFVVGKLPLMVYCGLSEAEAEDIIEQRNMWQKSADGDIADYIPLNTVNFLRKKLTFKEGNYYNIYTEFASGTGGCSEKLSLSLKITKSFFKDKIEYYQYLWD